MLVSRLWLTSLLFFSIQAAVGATVVTGVFFSLPFPAFPAIIGVSSFVVVSAVAGIFSVFSIHAVVGILLLWGSCCC